MSIQTEAEYPEAVKRVLSMVNRTEISYQLRSFEAGAHHAKEAADLLGCPLGAVVKSLVFQQVSNGDPLLLLVSGENRVDINALSKLAGGSVRPANLEEVRAATGYPAGAVPPLGMKRQLSVLIDEDLMAYDFVWGSAGSVNILIGMTPEDLLELSGGSIETLSGVRKEQDK